MIISASLLPEKNRNALIYFVSICLACLLLIGVIVILAIDIYSIRSRNSLLGQQNIILEHQLAEFESSDVQPSYNELKLMRDRIKALNDSGILHGVGASTLLKWFENSLPDTVYLVNYHHHIYDKELVVVADSSNEKKFTDFLRDMEMQPWYSGVVLNKKESQTKSGSEIQQYELRVTLK